MLIDLTRKPLIIYPEICPTAVVVRSIGNRDVNGHVTYGRQKELKPDAQISRGKSTLFETRLPLPGVWRREDEDPYFVVGPAWRRRTIVTDPPYKQERKADILPEPFEVASVFHDAVTNIPGTWRAGVRIQHVEKMKRSPWVVSILDVTTGATLSTVAVSTLDANPLLTEALPLTKAVQHTVAPGNAWTRILEDDD